MPVIGWRKGYQNHIPWQINKGNEQHEVTLESMELERLEIDLTGKEETGITTDIQSKDSCWQGNEVIGNELRQLPVGSFLDKEKGIFYWQPGPGFVGEYHLVFANGCIPGSVFAGSARVWHIYIVIKPKFPLQNKRQLY